MNAIRGRINRTTYFLGRTIITLFLLPLYALPEGYREGTDASAFSVLVLLAYISLALYYLASFIIRRIHDLGYSGWYALLAIIPGVELILLFLPGQKKHNKYGNHPTKQFDFNTLFNS